MCPSPVINKSGPGSHIHGLDLELFRHYFENFPDVVLIMDMLGRVVFLNNAGRLLTGCSLERVPLPDCSDFLKMDLNTLGMAIIEQCIDSKSLYNARAYLKDSAGRWLPVSLSAQPVAGAGGGPAGYVAIMREYGRTGSKEENQILASIFASVIDNFPMPFFTVDTNLTITYMNDHLSRLTGYEPGEIVHKKTCGELLRTPKCGTRDCVIKRAMERKTPVTGARSVIMTRESRKVPVAVHASMITDPAGRVIGGFEALRDITPLHEAEQKIRMLLEITPEGILMIDESRRVVYANSSLAKIFGQSRDELIGRDIGEFLPLQHLSITRELVIKAHREDFQQVRFCSTIQPLETQEEGFRVFETCLVAARVGHGLVTCMYFHELTKHIEIERQLLSANSFLNNIIQSSADGIIVVDTEGKVLIFNESAERILGYSAVEMIGYPDGLPRISGPKTADLIIRRMRGNDYGPPGKLTSTRIALVSKEGEEIPVSFSAAAIRNADREIGTVGIFSDLRERLRMRKELENARVQLAQAEKIASLGRLAAGVAHEINNPLSGILIYADMLLMEPVENPQWNEDLQEIVNQTLRCKQIVTRLLDFSRQSAGERIPCDINTVIGLSIELVERQSLFHEIEFLTDLDPDIPRLTGDPSQLQQVFTNIIINAGFAINGKGRITITSSYDPESCQVILAFLDTGPGIPPDIIGEIFEPFFTTKQPGEGTGLGLSVAYGIIQRHGGSIMAENDPSGGALFTVVLPLECHEEVIDFAC